MNGLMWAKSAVGNLLSGSYGRSKKDDDAVRELDPFEGTGARFSALTSLQRENGWANHHHHHYNNNNNQKGDLTSLGIGTDSPPHPMAMIEDERDTMFALNISIEQRILLIYAGLQKRSPKVRQSMLMSQDMLSSRIVNANGYDDGGGGDEEIIEVLWMDAQHLFMDIINHNRRVSDAFRDCVVYYSSLAGMEMRGVHKPYVVAVSELVWSFFLKWNYDVCTEDGELIPHRTPPKDKEEEDEDEEALPCKAVVEDQLSEAQRILSALYEPAPSTKSESMTTVDTSPPDVDVRTTATSSSVANDGKKNK